MNIKSMALQMYPYWLLGAGVLAATAFAGYKDVIRVEKKAVFDWIKFLAFITLYRVVLFKLFSHTQFVQQSASNVAMIPWLLTLTVFWEDACHGLPLFMIKKFFGDKKYFKPFYYGLMAMVMLEFGLGHVYQGFVAAAMLSLYIPYSVKLGEKYGFGTVMIGHTLFDLVTILTVKFLLGV